MVGKKWEVLLKGEFMICNISKDNIMKQTNGYLLNFSLEDGTQIIKTFVQMPTNEEITSWITNLLQQSEVTVNILVPVVDINSAVEKVASYLSKFPDEVSTIIKDKFDVESVGGVKMLDNLNAKKAEFTLNKIDK